MHVFLTSALVGGEWSASCPGHFSPRERVPGTHWIGGQVGPRAGLDDVEKSKFTQDVHGTTFQKLVFFLKVLVPTGTQTLTPWSFSPQPVTIPTALSRLSYRYITIFNIFYSIFAMNLIAYVCVMLNSSDITCLSPSPYL
jgi:hypothetical protein